MSLFGFAGALLKNELKNAHILESVPQTLLSQEFYDVVRHYRCNERAWGGPLTLVRRSVSCHSRVLILPKSNKT